MFQLKQLKTFLAAADTLSFTHAARRVHLTQPSVTEQIQSLEHAVGQPLFVRTNNTLALTPAGERLAVRARELLALADDTLRELRSGEEAGGSITVAAPQTLCTTMLVPLAAQLAQVLPALRVTVQEKNSSQTAQAVRQGTAHLGLVHGWPRDAAGLHVEAIARDQPVVAMPPGHALAERVDVTLEALATELLVATAPGCRYREYLDSLLLQTQGPAHIRAEADGVPSLLRMVGAGLGVAVLPRRSVDSQAATQLALRPLANAGEGLPICLLLREGGAPNRALSELAERLRQVASDEPVPALDVQHGPGGVAVAHEEDHGVRDVLGRAHAAGGQAGGLLRQ